MTDRSDLTRAVHAAHAAQDGAALAQAVAALDNFDKTRAREAAASRELDLGAHFASQRLSPVPVHELHTAATNWLADYDFGAEPEFRTAMIIQASGWYRGLDRAVKEDYQEFAEQAHGRAHTAATTYPNQYAAATQEFLRTAAYLRSTDAASGLPQIDQTVDPNNAPSPTPYPVEVFPTFGEEQDSFNGVETNSHGSGADSERAPMLQQIQQQNGGGSGYGSGPERQLTHDTVFNPGLGYAEVPLGAPGQISTAPAATDSMASSHPNPVAGQVQVAGADRMQAHAAIEGYSMPDPFGYRWLMNTEVMHPFHERCASAHWPDESCEDRAHTASVAIGYQLTLDQARRRAECETVGVREGLRAVASAGSLQDLGAHHNRVAAAWGASDRTDDDTAVLHGFMAVVRPVLAEMGQVTAKLCGNCSSGNHQNCSGEGCTCTQCHGNRKESAKGLAGGGGVTKSEREHARHHLPGTDKFPVDSAADVENAKHDIGRTNEPHSKVVNYINDMASEYGVAPVGGGKGKTKKDHAKAASRLDFT